MIRASMIAFLIAGTIYGQPPIRSSPKSNPQLADVLTLAIADCQQFSSIDRPFLRYIWVSDSDIESAKALSLAVNILSRGSLIRRPVPVGLGKLLVLRIDIRHYAPKAKDLAEWVSTWEKLQFDPRLNILLTKGTLKFAALYFPDWHGTREVFEERIEKVKDVWPGGPDDNGEVFPKGTPYFLERVVKVKRVETFGIKDVKDLARIPQPVLADKLAELQSLTGSQAGLVTDRYFLYRALSTVQDTGIFKEIWGGLYYEFSGIKRGAKKGTDEDVLFETLGVGNVSDGVTAAKIFENLRSDQRAAMLRSKVSGNPRRIDFFRTLAGRLDNTQSLISVTHDLRTRDIDIDQHPIANLLDFQDAARETIFEKSNGLHGYALFDGKGKLQDAAPDDVVRDFSIPAPHSSRLQGAISCISCHEAQGHDGWIPFTNDVKTLTKKLDIFGDLSRGSKDLADTLDRLSGLYQGNPERALVKARDDYAASVLRATGPWKGSISQTDVVRLAGSKIVKMYRGYVYDLVNKDQAVLELGGDFGRPEIRGGYIPEDPRIGSLRAGLSISRFDFDLVYGFLYGRAHNRR